ncbi:hypothetical protein J2R76_005816 [Bradyrhizobium sp. USDA 4532]|nr:hypothetical protein [Bradyrhizobium sp. USDA 4545]MCP1922225.1 hypothetical protein [Bradyrhizobium sp. USDA 4532]
MIVRFALKKQETGSLLRCILVAVATFAVTTPVTAGDADVSGH